MTWLDAPTMSAATALVVTVCGVLYLLDTLYRRGNAAAHLWSAAFVGGILTTLSYLAWNLLEEGWVANAVGNCSLVATMGLLWLGCARFNGPLGRIRGPVVGLAATLTFLTTLIPGPDGGDWAGAEVMFVSMALLAGLGALEARRGGIARFRPALFLSLTFGAASLFYAARTVVALTTGTASALFTEWFGTASASILTIVLTVVAVVAMTMLRVQSQAESRGRSTPLGLREDGFLDVRSFTHALASVIERARATNQQATVLMVRLHGVEEIGAAFGARPARDLTTRWRTITLRFMPLEAFAADDDGDAIVVALPGMADGEALNLGNRLSQHLASELAAVEGEIVPVIGVGIATGTWSRDAAELVAAAQAAAEQSIDNLDGGAVLDAAPAPSGQAVIR
ncbi:diguanylate cyclase [Pseudactinotalea terrae]|uniref:diguanylate cyclase n=1 Tax=Pseudactinotalea terrae TaxID=1743262 RepID=UPI0012E27A6E|nr:diguanylate cyclase [Pseudactinotalea terrae]